METLAAINLRQSIHAVRSDPIDKTTIEKLLYAGSQAPNHYKVRPWRFVVVTGAGLIKLGDVMVQSLTQRSGTLPADAEEKERAKPLRAPLIIAVGVDKPADPKISEVENICAAAAACQNILLAAHDLGLGAIWRTGPSALDPLVKDFLGFTTDQHVIAFIYIGHPAAAPKKIERPDHTDRTNWID